MKHEGWNGPNEECTPDEDRQLERYVPKSEDVSINMIYKNQKKEKEKAQTQKLPGEARTEWAKPTRG